MAAKILQFPKPKILDDAIPGCAKCECGEVKSNHCPHTLRCPVIVDGAILSFSTFRTFRLASRQELGIL